MMNHKRPAFVIPLVLMLISIAMVLITSIYQRGSLFVPFITTMYQQEQAKMLALSGIQIAMSELGQRDEQKKEPQKKEQPEAKGAQPDEDALFFARIFPRINQWQEFTLKKDIDGIDGIIKIALASEDGKINLNAIYDFVTKKFVGEGQLQGDWKKIMQQLMQEIQKKGGITTNLFEGFEKFLKQRQYKVNDASELLTIEAFRPFVARQFYEPPLQQKEQPLYLMDLFTVYGYGKLQPWFLADSLRTILGMNRTPRGAAQLQDIKKNFKSQFSVAKDWKLLFQPIYGIEFQRLPKGIDAVFATTFDPKLFSVVSYGVVGAITVRAYAILERIRRVTQQKTWYDIKIKKFYWI